jgi:Bacterial Ig domain
MSRPRALVVLLAAAAPLLAFVGCDPGPTVEITAPVDGTVIDHHGDVPIDVVITGDHLARVEVELDGDAAQDRGYVDPPLPTDGDCRGGCSTTVHWNGDEALVGDHVVTVAAWDDHDVRGDAPLALTFTDQVAVAFTSPQTSNLQGVAAVTVSARAIYRGAVDARLTIDDGTPVTGGGDDCRYGCQVELAWDTSGTPAGDHELEATATDAGGHQATATLPVTLDDIPWATAIRVTGESDGLSGRLEVELHLEDADTGVDLGCSGADQGMESVDFDDTDYTVFATFVRLDGTPLGMADLAGRNIRVHAIEDDSYPCPGPIYIDDDDMGTSPPLAAADLASVAPAFGEVTNLAMQVGRPYQR